MELKNKNKKNSHDSTLANPCADRGCSAPGSVLQTERVHRYMRSTGVRDLMYVIITIAYIVCNNIVKTGRRRSLTVGNMVFGSKRSRAMLRNGIARPSRERTAAILYNSVIARRRRLKTMTRRRRDQTSHYANNTERNTYRYIYIRYIMVQL